jgi:hypothetical protein
MKIITDDFPHFGNGDFGGPAGGGMGSGYGDGSSDTGCGMCGMLSGDGEGDPIGLEETQ